MRGTLLQAVFALPAFRLQSDRYALLRAIVGPISVASAYNLDCHRGLAIGGDVPFDMPHVNARGR